MSRWEIDLPVCRACHVQGASFHGTQVHSWSALTRNEMFEIVGAIIAIAYLIPGQDSSFKSRTHERCRRKEET